MLTLRPYQREALDIGIYGHFAEHNSNPLVVIPTGGGKSLCIAQFIYEAIENYPSCRILIVTHVKELISQNFQELIYHWPNAPAGIYSAGLKARQHQAQVLFCGIQSVHNKALLIQRCDVILIDEAHLVSRNTESMYGRFIAGMLKINPDMKIIGFTATPFRLDSGRLTEGKGRLFERVSYEVNLLTLILNDFLSTVVSQTATTQIDLSGVHTRGGEFVPGEMEAAALDPATMDAIVAETVAAGANRNGWLVFASGVKHGKELEKRFAEHIPTESVFGDTASAERAAIIDRFKRGQTRCLVSMGVITTGFNASHVDLICLARATKSVGLYIQIVGRGTRKAPGKKDCLLLDFGGNIDRHGPIDQPKVKTKTESDEKSEAPTKKCPGCGALAPLGARTCPECGAPFDSIMMRTVQTVPSSGAVLSTQIKAEWLDVIDVTYHRHEKPGKTPSLRVTYLTGPRRVVSEWICFEHPGFARQKAMNWWIKAAPGTPIPSTVDEAMSRTGELREPLRISVKPDGEFQRVVNIEYRKTTAYRKCYNLEDIEVPF